MHGTSRASGLLTQRMRGPAEFYKFRHPNRSYQRFYGWCLSRQRGRGQFPHTCQAETLQEFFSCREAQSAVHNNPTKTTTSGPMLRRAKAISYQSMLQDLEHRLHTYAHSLVDGHLQREYDLQLSKWKIYINRVAGAYGQAFKRHESTLQAAKAKQKADSDMVMLAFSFVGFLSMARPSGRCPTGATSPFSLDAQLDTVLRKAAGNNERFIILPPPPASVPLAPAMRLRKSEFLASNSWKSPAGLGATGRSTRRTQLDQENPDEFVSRRRRHSAPVNESTSEPLRRWRPSHPPGTRPERKPCPVHRAHHSFVSQKNTSHV
jgi:hypothetical protein